MKGKYVHCHICPLKSYCDYANPDATYKWDHDLSFSIQEYRLIDHATTNCPLRKKVIE